MLHNLVGERKVPYVSHILHIMEFHSFEVLLRNLVDVLLVVLAKEDVGDACAFRSKYLLLYSTNRKHLTA